MAVLQSPTLPASKTQPCSCHSASTHVARSPNPGHIWRKGANARGGAALSKRTRTMAPLNAGSGEPANANSVSAAELSSSQTIGSTAPSSEGILDLLLQTAELLLVLGVAGAQASMLLHQWQQRQQQQQLLQEEGRHSRSPQKHQELSVVSGPQWLPSIPDAVSSSGMQLALALILLLNWLLRKRMSLRQTHVAAAAGLSAGARLLRLELLASRHSQALLAAERQITKLNTRARLLGKDLQPPLRQVQAENIQQAETLVKLVDRVEGLNAEVQDTQQLIGALHGATAKQLQLVMQALALAQAAKALALSASPKPAAGRSPTGSNGALESQVTESARNESESIRRPEAVQHTLQEDLHEIAEDRERPASAEGDTQQQGHRPAANATQLAAQGSRDAASSLRIAADDSDARCECSSRSSGLLSGVITAPSDSAAEPWRHEAELAAGSRITCCSGELDIESSAARSSKQLRNRSWWPREPAGSTVSLEPESSTTAEEHCASHAGEALGEYVMYRF